MYSIYKTQGLDTLYQLMAESPEMMCSQELLRDRRNSNWIPVMESVMKNLTTFFADGAGQIYGSQAVLELLEIKI
jgi:hypothetical protein